MSSYPPHFFFELASYIDQMLFFSMGALRALEVFKANCSSFFFYCVKVMVVLCSRESENNLK